MMFDQVKQRGALTAVLIKHAHRKRSFQLGNTTASMGYSGAFSSLPATSHKHLVNLFSIQKKKRVQRSYMFNK